MDVGEGDGNITLELIATCISAIEFDFDVSIDTTDASAISEFPSPFQASPMYNRLYHVTYVLYTLEPIMLIWDVA